MITETGKLHFSPAQRHVLELPAVLIRDTAGMLFDVTPLEEKFAKDVHTIHNWYAPDFFFNQTESGACSKEEPRPICA